MTNKTAMQQIIEKLDAMISNGGDSDLHAAKVHAEQLLATEKQQIIDAFEPRTDYGKRYETGDQYYNQTYSPHTLNERKMKAK